MPKIKTWYGKTKKIPSTEELNKMIVNLAEKLKEASKDDNMHRLG
jgi:hypothetical protein